MMVRDPAGSFCTSKGEGELLAPPPADRELMDLLGDPMDAPPSIKVMLGLRTGSVFPLMSDEKAKVMCATSTIKKKSKGPPPPPKKKEKEKR